MTTDADTLREEIRRRYADAATVAAGGQQAMDGPAEACFGTALYDDLDGIPEGAGLASLGCGNPIAVADLAPGETVLDLGSGGGIDVLLSAKRVGPTGHAYGLDMTDEMLDLARRNAAEAGATNVTFLKGQIEQIPLPARIGRRDHLQLRHQPFHRQTSRVRRDAPRPARWRPDRDQ